MAPAYDVTFAHNPDGEWTSQHLMAVNGKFKNIERVDLLAVADRFTIGTAPRVIDEVSRAVARWREFARQARVGRSEADRIGRFHGKMGVSM